MTTTADTPSRPFMAQRPFRSWQAEQVAKAQNNIIGLITDMTSTIEQTA
jgi:hypothetical protein